MNKRLARWSATGMCEEERKESMKKILVTGGTTFVSKYTAAYFVKRGYEVSVLNRGSRKQIDGVIHLQGDRHDAAALLKDKKFDIILDITAYTADDINDFVPTLDGFSQYIMVSSSAVYPETEPQPFLEDTVLGPNRYWGFYGTNKIAAEKALLAQVEDAYIVRPPYLYGPMNNVYREAFVFDCAMEDRPFYLPKDGQMKMQFFMVGDLCRFFEILIKEKPQEHIFNVGNKESVSVKDWVTACYACLKKVPEFIEVHEELEQRMYFSFYDYEYALDVAKQERLLGDTLPLADGLQAVYEWYRDHRDEVMRKPYLQFIDEHFAD